MTTPCEERQELIGTMTFPPMPNGYIWVRWLVCDMEARAIELLTTPTTGSTPEITHALEIGRGEVLDKMKRDFCQLEGLVKNVSAKLKSDNCPWCNGSVCSPNC